MTTHTSWAAIKAIECDQLGETATLLEERLYSNIDLVEFGRPRFRIMSQKCSAGVECNLAGLKCRWSGLNPDYDPFAS